MADRIYPSSKPTTHTTTNPSEPAFPATKAQLYNASRPAYRPQPPPRKRSKCCSCCLWTTLLLALLLLLAAIFFATLYLIYQPKRPSFAVSSLRVSQFNLSSASHLSSNISLSILARNRNKKISLNYSPVSVLIFFVSSAGSKVPVGAGEFPGFTHKPRNTTVMKAEIVNNGIVEDGGTLRADMKNKKGLKLKIEMNTKVKVKIGKMTTKRVRVRVTCDGITVAVPSGKTATTTATGKAKCKVDLRVKIWKWTI